MKEATLETELDMRLFLAWTFVLHPIRSARTYLRATR